MNTIKKILKPLASLYLTVALLALSMLLVYAGTVAQKQVGIQDVQHQFFHSWLAWLPLDPMLRPFAATNSTFTGGVWMAGGYSLIVLLLVNLLAAHTVRFKLNWKRSGILLIHFGLILLLVGELVYSNFAVESQMGILEGHSSNWSQDLRSVELSVTDHSPADHDDVTVVPGGMLKDGAVIESHQLPFVIRIDNFFANSDILGPMQPASSAVQKATAGSNAKLKVLPLNRYPGTEAEKVNQASAFVTVVAGNRELGTYLLSQVQTGSGLGPNPERIEVDGKTYWLDLRFKRYYKPYTITLLKFSHDRFLGTNEARNFSSRIRLVDPPNHVDREVLIWMNHPLRYNGETFYQQSFTTDVEGNDRGTILQIAQNPGWLMPYFACAIGALGLLVHFGMHLVGFLRRQRKSLQQPKPTAASSRSGKRSNWQLKPTTLPVWQRPGVLVPVAAVLAGIVIVACMARAPKLEGPYDLAAFGRIPITSEGRTMPMDSLARNTVRIIRGREEYVTPDTVSHPAIQWLLDVLADTPAWRDAQIFRIDHPDVLGLLHLDPTKKYFSANDLTPHAEELLRQANLAQKVAKFKQDSFQRKVIQLAEAVRLASELYESSRAGALFVVPPSRPGEEWQTLKDASDEGQKTGKVRESARLFATALSAYERGDAAGFNATVRQYHALLAGSAADMTDKLDMEVHFNQLEPFYLSMILYVVVFLLACCSWLGWSTPLRRGALALLVFTLIVHTWGLGTRIYLQGRPPVTNLYSSAIFIGWGVAVLCVMLELVWRNTIGTVASAVIGFVTLIIAHHLANDAKVSPNGDTMAMLQAVLDTNLWLATHVVCVTLGYASTFLAGILGAIYVIGGVFTHGLDADRRKNISRMTYGVVCFAMFFSFVGTILGGIWADQSWGRFWGWDPKENGAILVVLWNALILHARWSGLVRQRGLAQLAIFGNVVTGWSWFGTNMLGIGLHSYGFMDAAVPWLIAIDLLHLGIIGVGFLPERLWLSSGPDERHAIAERATLR